MMAYLLWYLDPLYTQVNKKKCFQSWTPRKKSSDSVHTICPYQAIHGRIQRGTGGPEPPSLKNHKNIGFLSNISPDPQKNHKAI